MVWLAVGEVMLIVCPASARAQEKNSSACFI
jgi:hypothetical protein